TRVRPTVFLASASGNLFLRLKTDRYALGRNQALLHCNFTKALVLQSWQTCSQHAIAFRTEEILNVIRLKSVPISTFWYDAPIRYRVMLALVSLTSLIDCHLK